MSNIGKQPILIPDSVEVVKSDNKVTVKGKLGELSQDLSSLIQIRIIELVV